MNYLHAKSNKYFFHNPANKTPCWHIHVTVLLVFTTLFTTYIAYFLGLKVHVLMSKSPTSFTWPWPDPPPSAPLGEFLEQLAGVILGGSPFRLTWQVDLTSCHLSSDLKRGRRRGLQVNLTSATCQVPLVLRRKCVLLCFINPRVRKIRNEAFSCSGIFSRTLRFYHVANSPQSDGVDNAFSVVVGTGFWTSILSPVFWAGLSQITRFWTYQIPAAVPVLKGRVHD